LSVGVSMAFEDDGFVILPGLLSDSECDELIHAVSAKADSVPGSRTLLASKIVADTADKLLNNAALRGLIGDHHHAVQCTLFAKGAGAGWSVTPHQDLSIPVHERRDVPGWSGWSKKEGTWFVQPPVSVLEKLVAVRLQLDDHSPETGPLDVVPGTHRMGRLTSQDIAARALGERFPCIVPRGGVLVMHPLLIHASGKPKSTRPRRVLHYLYGPALPSALTWPRRLG
jgi:ectoine hydroxylase-related dioxygenase (phytanoyl-CoA dioxygenase family)